MMREKLVAGIKVNGKVMREFGDEIYIPFGSEYSIFLINLSYQKVQVNIEVDGKDILDGESLLINPWDDEVDLERWLIHGLNNGPKLKFVEKTEQIRETKPETGMDGIVKISYQFEKFLFRSPFFQNSFYHKQEPTYTSLTTYSTGPSDSADCSTPRAMASASTPSQISTLENNDGFTIKGSKSNQQFQEGYIGTLEDETHTICFQLKGGVKKKKVNTPITVRTKITCDACYKKNKSSYKFCTQCGNNLKYSR